MGHRLTISAWNHMKENFPEEIEKLICIKMPFDRNSIPSRWLSSKKKNKKTAEQKTYIERYGIDLGPVIDWLDANTNDQHYIDINRKNTGNRNTAINFYFFDEGDAMGFKLMFGEKDLTNE